MTSTSMNIKTVVFLGSSIASNASIHTEISRLTCKASGTFAGLSAKVSDNPYLTIRTKSAVYRACVCVVLYSSET